MRQYPSKLLLFGEHILLIGARALAVPVPAFGGHWAWRSAREIPDSWAERLRQFAHSAEVAAVPGLNAPRFQQDLDMGLQFTSTIPVGYGLGSSGALCAAVYDRYVQEKTTNLADLKVIFAGLESFFHGQSSGIDPLTSYLDKAIWISNRTDVRYFEPQPWKPAPPVVFLLDSGLPRQTGPLVQWFLARAEVPEFSSLLKQLLLPAHEQMLMGWASGEPAIFWPALRQVSDFQLRYMPPMIPDNLRKLWAECLRGKDVVFKICGAGGGGFVLGFAVTKSVVLEKFSTFMPVFPFEQHGLVEK